MQLHDDSAPKDGIYHLVAAHKEDCYLRVKDGRIVYATGVISDNVLHRDIQEILNRLERSTIWKIYYVGSVWRTRRYRRNLK